MAAKKKAPNRKTTSRKAPPKKVSLTNLFNTYDKKCKGGLRSDQDTCVILVQKINRELRVRKTTSPSEKKLARKWETQRERDRRESGRALAAKTQKHFDATDADMYYLLQPVLY